MNHILALINLNALYTFTFYCVFQDNFEKKSLFIVDKGEKISNRCETQPLYSTIAPGNCAILWIRLSTFNINLNT
jgi:hypothetical protein